MRAMIMSAGVGNRLMPLTLNVPKPMIPIANIPVMEYGVALLRQHNITEIIANLHYLPDRIADYFKDGKEFQVDLSFSREETLHGTAGGVKNNAWFLQDDTFVILSGDALTDIDLTEMINFHKAKGAIATIALKREDDVSEFGVVITDTDGKITAFQEKPKAEEALSNLVNTGIYIFEPEIFELIPDGVYDFGKELFPKLVQMNMPFYGYDIKDSYWCDVGSTKIYLQANGDMLNNKVKTTLPFKAIANEVQLGSDVELKGQVVIGYGSIIEAGAVIKDSVIWPRSIVKKAAVIMDSVVGNDCTIAEGCVVQNSIVRDELCCTDETEDLTYIK